MRVLPVETSRIVVESLALVSLLVASVFENFICIGLQWEVAPLSMVGDSVRQSTLLGRFSILRSVRWYWVGFVVLQ